MAWLARSIANSLKLDDDDEDEPNAVPNPKSPLKSNSLSNQYHRTESPSSPSSSSSTPTARGVKEDLSELKNTLTRQFWGVASFLAPPPEHSASHSQLSDLKPNEPIDKSTTDNPSDSKLSEEDLIAGIRSDFAEISGKFKTGISKLSNTKTVSDITKIASNFLQFGSEDSLENYDVGNAVGVTEEVLIFVRNIVQHPETWLDFPLPYDDDSDDLELSDAQQEHALAVEHLVPRLAALRIELCPQYMSEDCFWKIYFVLLHPRLSKHDAEILSTSQVLEARAQFHELQQRTKEHIEPHISRNISTSSKGSSDSSNEELLSVPHRDQSEPPIVQKSPDSTAPPSIVTDVETDKHPIKNVEIQVVDNPIIEEMPLQTGVGHSHSGPSKVFDDIDVDDADDWLKEETLEIDGDSGTNIPIGNDEDVSFSDLEDDDQEMPAYHKKGTSGSDSSTKDSRDWVQLSRTSGDSDKDMNTVETKHAGSSQVGTRKESSDWLNVDDIDSM
ncbi:putative BSD domain-containing protein [Cucumis melo var. makuwa]|uniref:BSD domain-containing protein n=2 Tax=Cucumis melo TaxID=3656 RepID=A0A5A7SYU7_CUCMM|nr:putative BSD domain-containing protein [Cucumis melo var. makuwa]TYK12798.1 putative BSD domain-containing protein [Cucumis melo var. makuwa]